MGVKRAAPQEAASATAKRRPTADPAHGKALIVARALLAADAAVLPASTAAMLAPLAEASLATPKEQRHAFQVRIVGMIEEALMSIKTQAECKLEETKAKVNGVFDDKVARQENHERAKVALTELENAISPKKLPLTQATEVRDCRLKELAEAQQAQQDGDKDCLAIEAQRVEAQKGFEALSELKVTSDGSKQSKLAVKTVIDAGKAFRVDPTLVGHAPQVLRKDPGTRSDFDKVVIEQLEQSFTRILSGFDEPLAAAAPAREERAAAVQEAQKAAEAAEQDVATCAEELRAAQEAAKAGASAVKAAHKAMGKWLTDSKALMDGFDELSAQFASFTSGALVAFEELKDLMPEPEPVGDAESAAFPQVAASEVAEAAPEEATEAATSAC